MVTLTKCALDVMLRVPHAKTLVKKVTVQGVYSVQRAIPSECSKHVSENAQTAHSKTESPVSHALRTVTLARVIRILAHLVTLTAQFQRFLALSASLNARQEWAISLESALTVYFRAKSAVLDLKHALNAPKKMDWLSCKDPAASQSAPEATLPIWKRRSVNPAVLAVSSAMRMTQASVKSAKKA